MSVRPFELNSIEPEAVDRLNLIASRLPSGQFTLGGNALQFRLAPLAGAPRRLIEPLQITLGWGGGQLHLIAPRSLLGLVYDHTFPQAPIDDVPQELALAGLQLALSELTASLEEFSGRRARVLRAGPADARSLVAAPYRFSVSLDSGAARDGIEAMVAADAIGLGLLALLANRQPASAVAMEPDTPISLRMEVGALQLPVSAVRSLTANDVLVLEDAVDATTPKIQLRIDQRRILRTKLDGQSLVVETGVPEEQMMNTPQKAGSNEAVGLDDIEIRLCFDLGETTLTLGALSGIRAGQVLALDAPPSQLVAIRANGRLIGRGELVRIADRVGVRVLQLGSPESRSEPAVAA